MLCHVRLVGHQNHVVVMNKTILTIYFLFFFVISSSCQFDNFISYSINDLIKVNYNRCDTLKIFDKYYHTRTNRINNVIFHRFEDRECVTNDNEPFFRLLHGYAIEKDSLVIIVSYPSEQSDFIKEILVLNINKSEFVSIFHFDNENKCFSVSHFSFEGSEIIEHLSIRNLIDELNDLNSFNILSLFSLDYTDTFQYEFSRKLKLKDLIYYYL